MKSKQKNQYIEIQELKQKLRQEIKRVNGIYKRMNKFKISCISKESNTIIDGNEAETYKLKINGKWFICFEV